MKKLLLLVAIFAVVFTACPTDDGNGGNENNDEKENADVIGIWTGSNTGSGSDLEGTIRLDIAASTWVATLTRADGTVNSMNGNWFRHGNTLTVQISGGGFQYGINNISASLSGGSLILTINSFYDQSTFTLSKEGSPEPGNGDGDGKGGTTLRIRNESFIGITDVTWNSVDFTDNQNSIIRTGTGVTKNVTAGPGFIYFKREGSPIAVRTNSIIVATDEQKEFVFQNDTPVMEVSNPGNNGSLQTFFSKSWIYLKQGTDVINLYGEYDFGGVLPGENKDIVFTIENIGGASLVLESVDGKRINLDENDAGLFSVTQQPLASTIAPGITVTFTIRFSLAAIGDNFSATVLIKTNSQNAEEFVFRVKGREGKIYAIGDTGPGGGMVFYAEGGQYKECSGNLGSYSLSSAITTTQNYRGGDFSDWHLPNSGELRLIYNNLYKNGLGDFSPTGNYWSSSSGYDITGRLRYCYLSFSDNYLDLTTSSSVLYTRAVRSFS